MAVKHIIEEKPPMAVFLVIEKITVFVWHAGVNWRKFRDICIGLGREIHSIFCI